MITDSFDIATETYINEEDFYGKQGKMVDTCIIIFSDQIYQKILTTYACKKYLKLEDVMALQISCLLYTREKRLHSISQN